MACLAGGGDEQENGIFQEGRWLVWLVGAMNRRTGFFRRAGDLSGLVGTMNRRTGFFRRTGGLSGPLEGSRTGERDFSGGQDTVTLLRHVHSYFV